MSEKLSQKEKTERKERRVQKILWIPILLIMVIVPLIMHVAIIYPDEAVIDVFNQTMMAEPYSNYKATTLMILSVLMAILLLLVIDKHLIKMDRNIKLYILGTLLFLGVSLISTICSKYSQVAWWGVPDRAEGMIITMCYIFIMLYTFYSLMNMEHTKYLIWGLSTLVVIVTIMGICDYVGYNLFSKNSFFKGLMISSEAKALGVTEITNDFESGKVIGTMVHYNYVGSFGAMIVPFFVTLTLLIKEKKKKILFAILALCSLFILFGSTSRAGLIGFGTALIVGLIVFAKQLVKRWKITVSIVGGFVAIIIAFNAVTGGQIFSRIPTLMADITGFFTSSDETFDYKDHIPVRDVIHEDNRMKLELQTGILYIENDENSPLFKDEAGQEVDYQMDIQGVFTTTDERFSQAVFSYVEVSGANEGEVAPKLLALSINNMHAFYFMLDDTKGVIMIDPCPIEEETIVYPETFGFKGKEKLGSARGYIWSRSIPMMKDTFLIGNGPDTFVLEFPQQDYLGKWWAYDTPNMIVDKAHNLYLALFLNNGGLALLGFLIMLGAYLVQCFKLYAFKGFYDNQDAVGIALMLAIVGYLGAGLFNDSIVAVAPVFWILLGAGMAVNFMVNKDKVMIENRLNKAVAMKRR